MIPSFSDVVIVGGGAAGFFAALQIKEKNPDLSVTILEKTEALLAKVRISGGGRCNVTHFCFDPQTLAKNYPRGAKELLGPFHRFQPKDTVRWFESHGVSLKAEDDGRMFPTSNSSETIISCFLNEAKKQGIKIFTGAGLEGVEKKETGFFLHLTGERVIGCKKLLFATGSNRKIFDILKHFGHEIEMLIPSLFTFNTPSSPLLDLSGISLDHVKVSLKETSYSYEGPILLTHFGFSGPAVLKLSAFAAKELFAKNYKAEITIDWLSCLSVDQVIQELTHAKKTMAAKEVLTFPLFQLPKKLYKRLFELWGITPSMRFQALSSAAIQELAKKLKNDTYTIDGKTTNKHEFVTCGGVQLSQVNFKTMESKVVKDLYFAGEVLDIDGITGGFNFQNAWTTAHIAAEAISTT